MSYREENGQVVLAMRREDYEHLLFLVAKAHAKMFDAWESRPNELAFMNRLNEGNPKYIPYKLAEKTP